MLNQPKRIQAMAAALLLVGLAMNPQPIRAQQDDPGAKAHHQEVLDMLEVNPGIGHSPISVMVKFKAGALESNKGKARQSVNGIKRSTFDLVPGLELLETRIGVAQAVGQLKKSPDVEYAEPDYVVSNCADPVFPTDSYWHAGGSVDVNLLWGMHNSGQSVNYGTGTDSGTSGADIDAPAAWSVFTGNSEFIIADIDSGLDIKHPDFYSLKAGTTTPDNTASNLWWGKDLSGTDKRKTKTFVNGWDFVARAPISGDPNGHGTHTAGTIGAFANNGEAKDNPGHGYGVVGVNWQCKIMPLRFLDARGSGTTSDAILALNFAVKNGAKVSNNSWGGGGFSQALYDAINIAKIAGHIFVAAAGNGGSDGVGDNNDVTPSYPASYNLPNIIAVAATDNDDHLASFSNYGNTVHIAAPGVNIVSTFPISSRYPGGFAWMSGTSMATPHVTGVVALVWGHEPGLSYVEVKTRICSTARKVTELNGKVYSGGVVDAYNALMNVVSP